MLEVQTIEYETDTVFAQQQIFVAVPEVFAGYDGNIRQPGYPSSVTLFIVFGLAILAVIKYNFGKNLLEVFQSFFNYRQAWRMFEERRESDRQTAILCNILYFLVVGIFVSIASTFFGASPVLENYAVSILFFSVAALLIYILKAATWLAFGVIFMVKSFSQIYIHSMFLYNRIAGLMVFPLVAVFPYVSGIISPYIIYMVIAVFVLSYLFRLFRIFQIINAQNVSVLYFILYLCTLEILPLLLFVKGCKILSENVIV